MWIKPLTARERFRAENLPYCACGCGIKLALPGSVFFDHPSDVRRWLTRRKFLVGHNMVGVKRTEATCRRIRASRAWYILTPEQKKILRYRPLCACGCGIRLSKSKYKSPAHLRNKAKQRFISGHDARGRRCSTATKKKISLANSGRRNGMYGRIPTGKALAGLRKGWELAGFPSRVEVYIAQFLKNLGYVFKTQYRVPGTAYTLDMFFPQHNLAVEVDGYPGHYTKRGKSRDRRRDRRVLNLGISTLRLRTLRTSPKFPSSITRHIRRVIYRLDAMATSVK